MIDLQMIEKDIGFVGEVTKVDPTILKVSIATKCSCPGASSKDCCRLG